MGRGGGGRGGEEGVEDKDWWERWRGGRGLEGRREVYMIAESLHFESLLMYLQRSDTLYRLLVHCSWDGQSFIR